MHKAGVSGLSKPDKIELQTLVVRKYKEWLKTSVSNIEEKKRERKPVVVGDKFVITTETENKFLEEYEIEKPTQKVKRNIEIYKKIRDKGMSLEDIEKETYPMIAGQTESKRIYPDLNSRASVKACVDSIKGYLNKRKGDEYELFIFPTLQKEYVDLRHDGGNGKPDFIGKDKDGVQVYISCKCFDYVGVYRMSLEECHAEIEEARKYHKGNNRFARVISHSYNMHSGHVITKEISKDYLKGNVPYDKKVLKLEE